MGRILSVLKRVRLIYRRSSTLTKAALMAAIVLSTAALLTLHLSIRAAQAQTESNRQQAAQLEQENDRLEENIDNLGSADSIDQIAGDELGLVDKDTVIIVPSED